MIFPVTTFHTKESAGLKNIPNEIHKIRMKNGIEKWKKHGVAEKIADIKVQKHFFLFFFSDFSNIFR